MRGCLSFILVFAASLSLCAQNVESTSPNFKSIEPKSPPATPAVTNLPAPAPPVVPADSGETLLTNLAGVVIVGSRDAFNPDGIASITNKSGVQVVGLKFLNTNEVQAMVKPYLGRPATTGSLKALERQLILQCRKDNHPVVDVTLPEQNVDSSIIQLVILEGKVAQVIVQHTGRAWFSTNSTRNKIRLKQGDPILQDKLLDDLNWINRNESFQLVGVAFKQDNHLGGGVDVILQEQDHFPLRLNAGLDNAGVKLVGENRYFGGIDWGNAFDLGGELNYQYTTDTDFRYFKAHSAVYEIPLPWRHRLTFFGSYANMTADFNAVGIHNNSAIQTGTSYQLSMRYAIPLMNLGKFTHEISFGFDYKYANNYLDFGFGPSALIQTPTEIEQFVGAYRALMPDPCGKTDFGAQAFYSPGNFSSENTTAQFNSARTLAPSAYYYFKLNAGRVEDLPGQFSLATEMTVQFSDSNLLPSEEFTLGGVETIRGYDERLANGDEGWVINTELRAPPLKLGGWLAPWIRDRLQFYVFCDYGYVQVRKPPALVGNELGSTLASVGPGLRYNINTFLSVQLDCGYQLVRDPALIDQAGVNRSPWQGNISVIASF